MLDQHFWGRICFSLSSVDLVTTHGLHVWHLKNRIAKNNIYCVRLFSDYDIISFNIFLRLTGSPSQVRGLRPARQRLRVEGGAQKGYGRTEGRYSGRWPWGMQFCPFWGIFFLIFKIIDFPLTENFLIFFLNFKKNKKI